MEKKKKAWTEPKLTAIVRRKPEEGILVACKCGLGCTGDQDSHDCCGVAPIPPDLFCPGPCATMSAT